MGEEEIKQYEEELFTEYNENGQTTIGKKVFTKNRPVSTLRRGGQSDRRRR